MGLVKVYVRQDCYSQDCSLEFLGFTWMFTECDSNLKHMALNFFYQTQLYLNHYHVNYFNSGFNRIQKKASEKSVKKIVIEV